MKSEWVGDLDFLAYVAITGDGNGEGCHGHWPVYEAAEESQRAGGGEKETAGQCGKDGGAQQAQGDSQ